MHIQDPSRCKSYWPSGVGRLDFVWVPAVRPEDEQPVKQRFDVGDHIFAFRVDLQQPSLFLNKQRKHTTQTLHTISAWGVFLTVLEILFFGICDIPHLIWCSALKNRPPVGRARQSIRSFCSRKPNVLSLQCTLVLKSLYYIMCGAKLCNNTRWRQNTPLHHHCTQSSKTK